MSILKALFSVVVFLVVLGGAAAMAGLAWFQHEVAREGPALEPRTFQVAPGETLVSVAERLEREGLIRDDRLLRAKARLDGTETAIKAGEFLLPAGASAAEILARLVEGEVIEYRITIPEGLTTAQILRLLEADPVLEGPLPGPVPAEGELLPDTYLFTRGTTRMEMVDRMATAQDTLLAELWPVRQDGLPVATPQEALILASVVEKETGKPEERGVVAGVFTNRLKRSMRLQSDPTVIYGVSRGEPLFNARGERRPLYRSELNRLTPWNTYQIDGLPETPICNPGRDSIAAVLDPPQTDYLYFVADGNGGHAFSRTLAEHNARVAEYRRYEREEIARERRE